MTPDFDSSTGRELTVDLCENTVSADARSQIDTSSHAAVATVEVWVTEALRAAARELENSWDVSLTERLADLNTNSVAIKFANATSRKRFLTALRALAEQYSNYISTGVPLPAGDPVCDTVGLRLELFQTDVFTGITCDLAQTRLTAVPCVAAVAELARFYHAALSVPFIRVNLQVDENVDRTAADLLEGALVERHYRLVAFLGQLVQCLPTPGVDRVLIRGVNDIEVNGRLTEFTGAAKRAILAAALLRNETLFGTDEFARVYTGEANPVEARHDFDNAMKALSGILPNVDSQTVARGKRALPNLQIKVDIADSAIRSHLSMLYYD